MNLNGSQLLLRTGSIKLHQWCSEYPLRVWNVVKAYGCHRLPLGPSGKHPPLVGIPLCILLELLSILIY